MNTKAYLFCSIDLKDKLIESEKGKSTVNNIHRYKMYNVNH